MKLTLTFTTADVLYNAIEPQPISEQDKDTMLAAGT